MNMRYGASLNPKWMVDALWRTRKVIFFAISAVSLAWNVVVVAESLGIHKTLLNVLSRTLLRFRDAGELLVQRPVVYMLLNLIMLIMVVKSGMLGGRESKQGHEGERNGRADKSVPIFENFDDHREAHAHEEQAFVSMKRRSSAVFFSYKEPALNSNVSFEQAVAGKPASLFTIEPLDSHSIEPRSMSLLSPGHIVGAVEIGNPMSAPPNIFAGHSSSMEHGSYQISHKNPPPPPQNGASPVSHENRTPRHSIDNGRRDDYDLNKQEFNERVETFITKFKRNLTMQRQDSFNRLLGLVGVGQKR